VLLTPWAPALAEGAEVAPSVGHYDRDRIMGASALFLGLNKTQVALVGPLESGMKRMDGALASLDLSVALTGGAIDGAQRALWSARLDERAGMFSSFFDAFQARFDEDGAAYQQIFVAALDRAEAALARDLGGALVECAGSGGSPFGLTGPGGARKSCPGEDLSIRIAAAWDEDPILARELAALGSMPWPELASYESVESALLWLDSGGAAAALDGWVDPSRLAQSIPEAAELLDTLAGRAEAARRELVGQSRSIEAEAEDAEAQLASIRERAKQIRLHTEEVKAALGSLLWQAMGRALKKTKVPRKKNIGICMNPSDWEACSGPDLTSPVRDALLDDRKLQKSLVKQLSALPDSPYLP